MSFTIYLVFFMPTEQRVSTISDQSHEKRYLNFICPPLKFHFASVDKFSSNPSWWCVSVAMTTRLCDEHGHPVKFVVVFLRGPSVLVMQFYACCGCFDPFYALVSEDNRGDDVQTVQRGSFSCFSFFFFSVFVSFLVAQSFLSVLLLWLSLWVLLHVETD